MAPFSYSWPMARKNNHYASNGLELVEGPESFLMSAWFYILRLKSGKLYIGATTDLPARYQDHQSGKACQTTKVDPPFALVYSETFDSFTEARKREAQVKRWSRAKKEALVSGDLSSLRNLSKSK
ncbi:MAG: GIY-YIG nuclease family protein [Deltaproteobacteria bacterium]|nr:GIY-YIG nuclease family protein [Deltaproteobacteria bacterium]